MFLKDLRPASEFASQFGAKAVIYGPPGSAKTPGINNAPRPLLLACEPGMLSMRGSKVPTWCGFSPETIDEFFKWFFSSTETKNFDTLAIDSVSQMAEIYLLNALNKKTSGGNKAHGQAAYGEMAKKVMEHIGQLYFTRDKHTYLICKEATVEEDGFKYRRPYFPGRYLPVEIPHMFDFILHLAIQNVPGMGQVSAFRCIGSIDTMARNRTGTLAEFEPPHIGQLYQKALA